MNRFIEISSGALCLAASVFCTQANAQAIAVTLSSADQTQQLQAQPNIAFGNGGHGTYTINVDPSRKYQIWDGVGAAMTDSSASVISAMSSQTRNALMQQLFSPTAGIGLSFLRVPMGATDYTNGLAYSYDDNGPDPSLTHFSIGHDEKQMIPLIKQAQSINPSVKVMITPWSPPAWMKTPNPNTGPQLPPSMSGGTFNFTYADTLAQYFVKTIQGYQADYVPIYAMTVQNEPLNNTASYPSEYLDQNGDFSLINDNIGPALYNSGFAKVKIFGYDLNWDNTAYPNYVAGSSYTAGSAFHCYAGDPSGQSLTAQATGKDTWMTECTEIATQSYATDLELDAQKVTLGPILNGSRASVMWNVALNELYGPQLTGGLIICKDCIGVVDVNQVTNAVTYSSEYYAMGHIGRFVVPGASRIAADSQGNGGVLDVAFQNSDGTIAVIAYNDSGSAQTLTINSNNQLVDYPLAAGSMVTLKWQTASGVGFSSTSSYSITNGNSNLCVEAAGNGITNGTTLVQDNCVSGAANQQWQLLPTDSGFFRIVGRAGAVNQQVWSITGGDAATQSQVPMQTSLWVQGTSQQFSPVHLTNGKWNFISRNGGLCLDVSSSNPGTVLQQVTCNSSPSQQFALTPQ